MRDRDGEVVDPRDVLDDEELRDYQASRRARAHGGTPRPRLSVFPTIDRETGLDRDGAAWGARTYGGSS